MAADMSEKKEDPATLNVSSEEVKLNVETHSPDLDLHDRDPNHMHDDVKVRFQDIIGEPDKEIYSFDKIWLLSFKVFTLTKLWVYRITSLIFALPVSLCCGVCFACTSFFRIWCCIPCLRCIDIDLFCVKRVWGIVIQAFIAPCCEAYGLILSSIRIKIKKWGDN